MKRNLYIAGLVTALAAVFTGCLPDKAEDALIYKGPTVVEFKNHTVGQVDTILNRKGVYTCTAQTDSSRSVNQDFIAYKAAAATPNTLSCVAAANTNYRLAADPTRAANPRVTDSILVQLVGPQSANPTVINYTVRPTSTAVEGVNYNFRTPGARSVTIPANKSAAYILIDIPQGVLTTANTSRQLILDLVGNSEVQPSANFKKFLLTIRKN
ncbi:hypothetical protein [Mucilaginibacter terrae]|uniref:Uncharacterized protein n=1 Tax=Mucilaginibacter terrae TaxID=1955052 RepID=A0ABU3GZP6_9SPHI|nr:hypothetical protein [Mucilaginibacter terrae]MDT3405226.1 hypothetical protein [Mucilaginibacter terrae]